jgi:uncharacterized membrane protein HdeD (DUF308 family)
MSDNAQQLKQASRRGMIWGFLTILFGLFAIGSPFVAGLSTAIFIGIALLAAGISMAIFAFQAPSFGRGILKFLFGLLTIVIGVAIVSEPGIALTKLTLFLGLYFFFDGFLMFVLAWNVKPEPGWGWMTFNGAVTILLAYLVLNNWPESALWAIGLLVGIRLLFSGVTMLTMGAAGSEVARATGDSAG